MVKGCGKVLQGRVVEVWVDENGITRGPQEFIFPTIGPERCGPWRPEQRGNHWWVLCATCGIKEGLLW